MTELANFGPYLSCVGHDQAPITVLRVPEEVVSLRYHRGSGALVEWHSVADSENFSKNEKLAFFERARSAASLRHATFPRFLDVGESEGRLHYTTDISDGEFLLEFLQRTGPLEPAVALSMTLAMVDALLVLQPNIRLFLGSKLDNQMVVLTDNTHLTPRIIDIGLGSREPRRSSDFDPGVRVTSLSRWLFFMLAGHPFPADQPEQILSLEKVGEELKAFLDSVLGERPNPPQDLESLQRVLLDCLQHLTGSGSYLENLAVPKSLYPRRCLAESLFGHTDPRTVALLPQCQMDADSLAGPLVSCHILGTDTETNEALAIQFLPPGVVCPMLENKDCPITPKAEETDGLLRCLGGAQAPNIRCVMEEPYNGFSLSEFLAARAYRLTKPEVVLLMRATRFCLSQAASASIPIQCLTTQSVIFHFPQASHEELLPLRKKAMQEWPECHIKVRCHCTLDGLMRASGNHQAGKEAQIHQLPNQEQSIALAFIGLANAILQNPWEGTFDDKRTALDSWINDLGDGILDPKNEFDYDQFLKELESRLPA